MKTKNLVRSWKDEDYLLSLSSAEQSLLSANPAGLIELTDSDLGAMAGGTEDKSWAGCYSETFFCPQSHIGPCTLFACPTGDWIPCSWFDCPILI